VTIGIQRDLTILRFGYHGNCCLFVLTSVIKAYILVIPVTHISIRTSVWEYQNMITTEMQSPGEQGFVYCRLFIWLSKLLNVESWFHVFERWVLWRKGREKFISNLFSILIILNKIWMIKLHKFNVLIVLFIFTNVA